MANIQKQEYDTFTREALLRHREEEAERFRKEKEKAKIK
jgi:hypothetical protein|tara:strand:- start:369 stop:485 length:117 start_codon:yes stop_codon:yes gene_type:complete